jgi:hypothetical protein
MNLGEFIRSFLLQFSIGLARFALGVFFAISGGNKLFVAGRTRQMYETLTGAGIPFPHFHDLFRLLGRVHRRLLACHRVAFEVVLRCAYHRHGRRNHNGSPESIPS